MLLGGEKFRMRGAGICRSAGDGDRRVDVECDRRQADLVAAGLVAQLQRDVLEAQRSISERCERKAENNFVLINVQRSFREREGMQFSFGVRNIARGFEPGREIGAEIGGNKVVGGRLARIDVEAVADLCHHRELEGAAAGDGLPRNKGRRRDHFAPGRNLRRRRRQCRNEDEE